MIAFAIVVAIFLIGAYCWWKYQQSAWPYQVMVRSYTHEQINWLNENVVEKEWRMVPDSVDRPVYFKQASDAVNFTLTFSSDLEV